MNRYSWLRLGFPLVFFLATPGIGRACLCLGPKPPISEDAPVVIGTVLVVEPLKHATRYGCQA